jgi:nucleoside-diphosphate-sugar epimerase
MATRAVIAGVTGLIGGNLAEHLVSKGWEVHGIARKPLSGIPGVRPIAADLLDPEALRSALAGVDPTHVLITTWLRRATEDENVVANGAMVRNLLAAVEHSEGLRHVALVTGLKHYLGPFEAYARFRPETPLREEMPRLPYPNFYHAQEDELFDAARRRGFTWCVHRAHTTIGYALGNAMNMGVTLAVYATICRETGRPFVFPGSPQQWDGLTDVTGARVLAKHLEWAATSDAGRNEAFNVVNGDIFRWRWLWPKLAADFGIEAAPSPGRATPLEPQLARPARPGRRSRRSTASPSPTSAS